MRIAIFVPSLEPEFGGPAAKARSLAGALRGSGHQVRLLGCGNGATGAIPIIGRFHGTPVPASFRLVRQAVVWADVVHVVGYRDPVGTAAALGARKRQVPYLLEPVGMHRRRLRSLRLKGVFDRTVGHRVTAGAAAVIATSRIEARELAEDAIDAERIFIRPNGIDLDGLLPLPHRGAFRNRVGIAERQPLVLFLGRIAGKKGLMHLVEAVAQVPNVLTAIIGPDDGDGTVAALARTIGRLGVEDRVFLIPQGIWGREKAEALADADSFCLPSATENFGNSAAEAAAVGLPVILSDRCGVGEFLEPGACRVVSYGDVQALKDAVIGLSDPGPREAAARAAPGLRELLNWDELAVRQLEIYQKVVG